MAKRKQTFFVSMSIRFILIFTVFELFPTLIWGQLDSVHYLPPLYSGNNDAEFGYLYISTNQATPFPVTISCRIKYYTTTSPYYYFKYVDSIFMVSNSTPVVYYPTSASNYLALKTTSELNTVLPEYGIIARGPKEFYVSYRIFSSDQAGCITSKGKTALGTTFRVGHLVADEGNHTVGIMATENNTQVTISDFRPGTYLMGAGSAFLANTPITVTLNAGESYVIAMDDGNYQYNFKNGLFGLLITSNKSVAVNCGSWLGSPIDGNFGSNTKWDIGIDQIVPLDNVGNEYILIKGEGPYSIESGLVVGHYDSTKVFVNESTIPIILNAGQYLNLDIYNYFDASGNWKGNMYIKTDKKVFMYQSLGGGSESKTAALNFVPQTSCQTGSFVDNIPDVDYIGSKHFVGEVQVVASSNANTVEIRRNGQLVPLGFPIDVQGNPDYVIYRTDLDGTISVNSDRPIQVAISGKSGAAGQGGYYSDFKKTLIPKIIISSNQSCLDTLFLHKKYINGGVTWYLNNQLLNTGSQVDSVLAISQPGDYMVIGKYITFCNEEVFDTAYYTVPDNFFSVDADVVPLNCNPTQQQGQITVQVSGSGIYKYSLDNGAFGATPVFEIQTPGQHIIQVQDQLGCTKSKVINVPANQPATFAMTICPGETVEVNGTIYSAANPAGTEYIPQPTGCDSVVNVLLTAIPPAISIVNNMLCKGDSLKVDSVVFNENHPFGSVTMSNASVYGCDSIVEVNLSFLPEIKIDIDLSSCNPADTGMVVHIFQSQSGCDSTVTVTTIFRDTVFVEQFTTTCDPALVGDFTQHIGCDSVIKTTVSLDISGVFVQYDTIFTCDHFDAGLDTIFINGQNWCDGVIFRTKQLTQTIFLEHDKLVCRLSEAGRDTFFFGCDSVVYVNKLYDWANTEKTLREEWVCQSNELGIDTFRLVNVFGCDSLDIVTRKLAPTDSTTNHISTCNPDNISVSVKIWQNRYGCDSIVTTITTFEWSNIPVTNLTYYTCHIGEVGVDTLIYNTPENCDSLLIIKTYYDENLVPVLDADVTDESCHGRKDGSILLNTFKGTPPFSYFLDGVGPIQGDLITELAPGNYQIFIVDSLGCADSTVVSVLAAQELTAILSTPARITMCDTIRLVPEINLPGLIDSIIWSPDYNMECTDCLTPMAYPKKNTIYELQIFYGEGCVASANQMIEVTLCKDRKYYVPNVFNPDSNYPNCCFTIYSDKDMLTIRHLQVFDRWGNMVFDNHDFEPNDPNLGWDGSYKGKIICKPDVYVWRAELEYANGEIENASGDVTLVR